MDIEIVRLEPDFVVCVKPQGVPSQPDPSGNGDVMTLLSAQLRAMGDSGELYPVHRLDRATGGIMVLARTRSAAAELSRLVSEHENFKKIYVAAVAGVPAAECGEMRDFLFRDGVQKKAFVVGTERRGAKLALLDYELIGRGRLDGQEISLLRIRLHTGRFHQIRAQLANRGMPIVGDGKYGSRIKAKNIALWACELSFRYLGREYSFSCEPVGEIFKFENINI